VFNYHRIGDSEATPFDPNVFSCDTAHFDMQLAAIRSRFQMVTIAELGEMIELGRKMEAPLALVTFDDGYRDNYTNAFPVLKAHQMSAVFFVATSFVGSQSVPWWDEVAWMVKTTNRDNFVLPGAPSIRVDHEKIGNTIRETLIAFKRDPAPIHVKLRHLQSVLERKLETTAGDSLFMNWEELREMRKAGMEVGSHSHSHAILSHLSEEEQFEELSQSRTIIERELGEPVFAVAYPVGGTMTYTTATQRLVARCGYQIGFSFDSGFNCDLKSRRYDLRRIAVEENCGADYIQFISAFSGIDLNARTRLRRRIRSIRNLVLRSVER
jgi:peptidoglycan/xylan/chitin deacetylase (PgdA/CDA1 family)